MCHGLGRGFWVWLGLPWESGWGRGNILDTTAGIRRQLLLTVVPPLWRQVLLQLPAKRGYLLLYVLSRELVNGELVHVQEEADTG